MEYHEHARKQGEEEECLCTFILYWLHGPKAGNLTATTIGQICQIQPSGQIDPQVASFLKLARERFLVNGSPALISKGNGSPNMQHKKRFLQCLKQTGYFQYEVFYFLSKKKPVFVNLINETT